MCEFKRYKAMATDEAIVRVVTAMPYSEFQLLVNALEYRGESLREAIGRAACRADRFGDFTMMEMVA